LGRFLITQSISGTTRIWLYIRRCSYITQRFNNIKENRYHIGWGALFVLIGFSLVLYGQNQDLWLSLMIFILLSGLLAIVLGIFEPRNILIMTTGYFMVIVSTAILIHQFVGLNGFSLIGVIVALSGLLIVLRYLWGNSDG
jgi:hypothetical protein